MLSVMEMPVFAMVMAAALAVGHNDVPPPTGKCLPLRITRSRLLHIGSGWGSGWPYAHPRLCPKEPCMGQDKYTDLCTQLLLQARGGDPQAFAALHVSLSQAVRDFAASLDDHLDKDELDDIVQEVFMRVWCKHMSYRGEASGKTFVLAIARNVVLKDMSERRRLPIVHTRDFSHIADRTAPIEPIGSRHTDVDGLLPAVRQAMVRLTDAQRRAVELDLSHNSRKAAAEAANCTPRQFADRLYRARKRLRQMLNGLPRCVLM